MPYVIKVSVYELKANLSKYLRALHRGDCDALIINRYGRDNAVVTSYHRDKPALPPQTKEDIGMRARAVFIDTGRPTRRQ